MYADNPKTPPKLKTNRERAFFLRFSRVATIPPPFLVEIAMQIIFLAEAGGFVPKAILFVLVGRAFMQVIELTTFVDWMFIFEGVTLGLLFMILICLVKG